MTHRADQISPVLMGSDTQPSDFEQGAPPFPPPKFSTEVSAPARQRWIWFLSNDSRIRRVLERTLIGNIAYAVGLLLVTVCAVSGEISFAQGQFLAAGAVLTLVALYAALRSGWTLRFRDPSISLAQILVAMTWIAVNYALTARAHAAQLSLLCLAMAVAVFSLDLRGARISCAWGVAVMTISIALSTFRQPDVFIPKAQFLIWTIVASGLPTTLLMGTQLARRRMRMKTERAELRHALERLKDLATHDELTGLRNRAHMIEMLEHYMSLHDKNGEIFSIALIDLDHFKLINDTHGHGVGDEVLQAFARVAKKTLREIDLIARWGGEEFLVLFPQSSPDQALIGLDRLRHALLTTEASAEVEDLRVRFSAGITAVTVFNEPVEVLLTYADAALYEAKNAGRNRAVVHALPHQLES